MIFLQQIISSTGSIAMPPQMRPFRPGTATTTAVTTGHTTSAPRFSYQPIKRTVPEAGPPITVFVGNIVEHAPDMMIRQILSTCGHVISWKRIQGSFFIYLFIKVSLKKFNVIVTL